MSLGQFNALKAANLISARGLAATLQLDPNIMPSHITQNFGLWSLVPSLACAKRTAWVGSKVPKPSWSKLVTFAASGSQRSHPLQIHRRLMSQRQHQEQTNPQEYNQFKANTIVDLINMSTVEAREFLQWRRLWRRLLSLSSDQWRRSLRVYHQRLEIWWICFYGLDLVAN